MVVLVWRGGVCQKKCISITIFSYLRHYSILKQCLCECLFLVHIVTWTKTKIINKLLRVHNTDWKSSLNVNFFKNQLCNWSGSSSSPNGSHEWLNILWEDSRTNIRNNPPSPKTITTANKQNSYKLTRAATLLTSLSSFLQFLWIFPCNICNSNLLLLLLFVFHLGHHVPSTLPWSDQEGKTRATNVGPSVTYHDAFLCVINRIYSYM